MGKEWGESYIFLLHGKGFPATSHGKEASKSPVVSLSWKEGAEGLWGQGRVLKKKERYSGTEKEHLRSWRVPFMSSTEHWLAYACVELSHGYKENHSIGLMNGRNNTKDLHTSGNSFYEIEGNIN